MITNLSLYSVVCRLVTIGLSDFSALSMSMSSSLIKLFSLGGSVLSIQN